MFKVFRAGNIFDQSVRLVRRFYPFSLLAVSPMFNCAFCVLSFFSMGSCLLVWHYLQMFCSRSNFALPSIPAPVHKVYVFFFHYVSVRLCFPCFCCFIVYGSFFICCEDSYRVFNVWWFIWLVFLFLMFLRVPPLVLCFKCNYNIELSNYIHLVLFIFHCLVFSFLFFFPFLSFSHMSSVHLSELPQDFRVRMLET